MPAHSFCPGGGRTWRTCGIHAPADEKRRMGFGRSGSPHQKERKEKLCIYRDKLDKVIRGGGKSSWEIEEFRKQNLKSIKIEALDAGFAIETLEKELESPCADMEAIKAFVRGIGLALKKIEVLAG